MSGNEEEGEGVRVKEGLRDVRLGYMRLKRR
jgi:hypothetical protein